MSRLSRKRPSIYHDVGWPDPGECPTAFSEIRLPEATVRLLDRRVHLKALDEAGSKLIELLRRSGRRELP